MSDSKPFPGQPCPMPECNGYLHVYSGKEKRAFRVRYLCCGKCGHRPLRNKISTPAEQIRRRKPRA